MDGEITTMRRMPSDARADLEPNGATRLLLQPPKAWWSTSPTTIVDRDAALDRYRSIKDDVRRHEQNRWLGKHAKLRRFEFSADQKQMLKQWFDALDSDGSGKISVEELEDPMLSIGVVSDKSEIGAIVGHLDKDGSGSIDFKEFVEFLTPHPRANRNEVGKHEQMFMLLTKKMEHQSAGFLGINTQLSMERRHFILEAITRQSTQSLLDDIELLNAPTVAERQANSTAERHRIRYHRIAARQKKLKALETQSQVTHRFEALQEVLSRNSIHKSGSEPSLHQSPLNELSTRNPVRSTRSHESASH